MALSSSLVSGHRDHPTLGIATFVGNLLLMALLSAAVRELVNREYPLSEVLLFRYLFASGFFWIILLSTAGLAGRYARSIMSFEVSAESSVSGCCTSRSLEYRSRTRPQFPTPRLYS